MCSFAPFSNSNKVSWCWWSCPRWSKVSPDHILNESVLRSEDPLSTAVLLALSKTKPKGSQREKEGGGGEGGRKERERSRSAWPKVAVMYLALSFATPCHTRPHRDTPPYTDAIHHAMPRHAIVGQVFYALSRYHACTYSVYVDRPPLSVRDLARL